jgi:hypothetical protein
MAFTILLAVARMQNEAMKAGNCVLDVLALVGRVKAVL